MILIGGDVNRVTLMQLGLPREFLDHCEIKKLDERSILEIKLKSWARGSECEKIYLQRDFTNIELLPDVKAKTEYFRDVEGLQYLLKMYIEGVDTRHLSENIIRGIISNHIDSDGTPVTVIEPDVEEPEPETDPYGVQDIVLPKAPKLNLVLDEVEDAMPTFAEDLKSLDLGAKIAENKDKIKDLDLQLEHVRTESIVKNKEDELERIKKLPKDADIKDDPSAVKKEEKPKVEPVPVKKRGPIGLTVAFIGKVISSFFALIRAMLFSLFGEVGSAVKTTIVSFVGTICVLYIYSQITGKHFDTQTGVTLYDSFKSLVQKAASDIQNYLHS